MFEIAKHLVSSARKILKNYYTYIILLLSISAYFTLTPFLKNTFQTPPNRIYLGAENNYDTYFKYLKIINTGQNLKLSDLKTKLNQSPSVEKFYLINGKISSLFALSQFSSYHFSRLFFNFLFFLFSYLIISRVFRSRPLRLTIYSFLFFVIFPLLAIGNWSLVIGNFFSYPHVAFARLLFIIFIFVLLKLLKLPKIPNQLNKLPAAFLIVIFLTIGFAINSRNVSSLKIDLKKDPATSGLIYPSKDFYEGIGYLRDNAAPNEKVICLKRCAQISEVFAGISPSPGSSEDLSYEISTIWDNKDAQKKFQKENAVYWFFGPEERPLLSPDFGRFKPKEVFKNKEVQIFRLELKPST